MAVETRTKVTLVIDGDTWPVQSGEDYPPDTFKLIRKTVNQRRDGRSPVWADEGLARAEVLHSGLTPDELASLIGTAVDWLAYRGEAAYYWEENS